MEREWRCTVHTELSSCVEREKESCVVSVWASVVYLSESCRVYCMSVGGRTFTICLGAVGSPPPPTPQPNTTTLQTHSQIEMGSGASSSTTSAAAHPVQVVPATGGPNVSNEIRVTFPSGAPLGVGLIQRGGEVVVDYVQPTSAAAAASVPVGAIIDDVCGVSCEGKSMRVRTQ